MKGTGENMNRYFAVIAAVLICVLLIACTKTPPSLPETSSMQDVESMIEPLETPENSGASSEAVEPGISGSSTDAYTAAESSVSEQASSAPPSESVHEPQNSAAIEGTTPKVSSSVPELLPSVSTDKRLDNEKIELELLRLINEERAAVGVESLGLQDDMLFAARIRAGEALSSFSHTRPNGAPYNTAFDEAGFVYTGKWHGENLASLEFTVGMFDEESAALEMFSGLKTSPGHYRNMISDKFLQAGIGVSIAFNLENISIASVQLFSSL